MNNYILGDGTRVHLLRSFPLSIIRILKPSPRRAPACLVKFSPRHRFFCVPIANGILFLSCMLLIIKGASNAVGCICWPRFQQYWWTLSMSVDSADYFFPGKMIIMSAEDDGDSPRPTPGHSLPSPEDTELQCWAGLKGKAFQVPLRSSPCVCNFNTYCLNTILCSVTNILFVTLVSVFITEDIFFIFFITLVAFKTNITWVS